MLPRKKRLNRELFGEINKGSKKLDTPLFLLKARFFVSNETARFSCVVSKKVSKSAVSRNRLRRVFYEALNKSSFNEKKGLLLVFHLKPSAKDASFKDFQKNLETVSKIFKNS